MGKTAHQSTQPTTLVHNNTSRLDVRNEDAFVEAERQGLMLAAKVRTIALLVIITWQIIDNPDTGPAYVFAILEISSFAVLGVIQFICAKRRIYAGVLKYIFVLVDCALLAVVLTVPNPFDSLPIPPAVAMDSSRFMYFMMFLMQATFSLRPSLVVWCGLCITAARSGMLLWFVIQPQVTTNFDLPEQTAAAFIEARADPNFIFLGFFANEVVICLLIAAGLALVVRRSNRLVKSRAIAERSRASLARYFSPNVVDHLSNTKDALRTPSEQIVAVLFADIIGFTRMCESDPPDSVIEMLRNYHNRLGPAVFNNGGTLDKYIGDGLMATFGTPYSSASDAGNALKCALEMITALRDWNDERSGNGVAPVRVGIGIHYGPVIAGDIGNDQRLEYSVIGDTVNIASRLENLTRTLNSPLVVSDSLVKAIAATPQDKDQLLRKLTYVGPQSVRGRSADMPVWKLDINSKD